MNSVDRVKALCKERKIPIAKLERELGFGNGYISQLKKGVFPYNRLVAIANYLNVSAEELTGEQTKKAPTISDESLIADDELSALLNELTEAELELVKSVALTIKQNRDKAAL